MAAGIRRAPVFRKSQSAFTELQSTAMNAAAERLEAHRPEIEALQERVRNGRLKIGQAALAGVRDEALQAASQRVNALQQELDGLLRLYTMPIAVLDDVFRLAQSLKLLRLPKDSSLTVIVPGAVDLTVSIADPAEEMPL